MTAPGGKPDAKSRGAVRSLVSEIIVSPVDGDAIPVEVRGRMSALVTDPTFEVGGAMVAEEATARCSVEFLCIPVFPYFYIVYHTM